MGDIFLSYSRDDSMMMEIIRDNLRKLSFNIWVDVEYLEPGTAHWSRAVKNAIQQVDGMVVLCSPAAESSEWVNREVYMAKAAGKPILPVLVRGTEFDSIPVDILGSQYIDLRGRSDRREGFHSLVRWLAASFGWHVPDYEFDPGAGATALPTIQVINVSGHVEGHVVGIGGSVQGELNIAGRDIHREGAKPEEPAPPGPPPAAPSSRPLPAPPRAASPASAPSADARGAPGRRVPIWAFALGGVAIIAVLVGLLALNDVLGAGPETANEPTLTVTTAAPTDEPSGQPPVQEQGSSPTNTAAPPVEASGCQDPVHVVEAGETIRGIADQYGVSVEDVIAANDGLDPDLIEPDQELIIPLCEADQVEPVTGPAAAESGVSSNSQWEPYTENVGGVEMALVPAGCFQMGSNEEWEKPIHQVCFDRPFWIDVYEVTNAQFDALGGQAAFAGNWTDANLPRENVTSYEAAAFCNQRGARLPTEAEWEYAARGPDSLIYPWGNTFVAGNAVYDGNSDNRTWEVGSKPGGVSWIGAYDMSGNVSEWVSDWFDENYYATLADGVINPQGPATGDVRSARGGNWVQNSNRVRGAFRDFASADVMIWDYGFRCARSYSP